MDQKGQVLGHHRGIIRYTHGQHKGLGLSTSEPLYVLEKDAVSNTIRLGPDSDLWSQTLTAEQFNWVSIPEPTEPIAVTVKMCIRDSGNSMYLAVPVDPVMSADLTSHSWTLKEVKQMEAAKGD